MGKYLKWYAKKSRYKVVDSDNYSDFDEMLDVNIEGTPEPLPIPLLNSAGFCAWYTDDGQILGMKPSLIYVDVPSQEGISLLYGDVFFAKMGKDGEYLPLTDDDIDFIKEIMDFAVAKIIDGDHVKYYSVMMVKVNEPDPVFGA